VTTPEVPPPVGGYDTPPHANEADGAELAEVIDGVNEITSSEAILEASAFQGIDLTRLARALDTSWMTRLKTSALQGIDLTAITRAIDTSASIHGLTTSWLEGLNTSWLSTVQASALQGINLTAITRAIDTSASIHGLTTSWLEGLNTSWLEGLNTSWLEGFGDLIRRRVRGLPSNWLGVSAPDVLDDDKLRLIVLEEGIPLAWVPGAALIERIMSANDAAERRQLIRNGWRGILRDCERAATELPSRQARSHARFIHLSASAIAEGHYEAGQALAANLVDTLGRSFVHVHLVGYNWSLVTAKNQRTKLSKLALRALLVLGPLAVGHSDYRPGDSVPRAFSRHATAHGVSRKQYTKVNSLLALMNATALLCWLERDTDAFRARSRAREVSPS
jgi:hypothetical protein